MTTNNYWQHTILLQCSLHGVRNEFLQLCVELCRCYAPLERQLYYQEDPDIGQQQYLSAVPRRRQQEEVEEGCGEDARRKRQQGGAVDQGSRDEVCLKCFAMCPCRYESQFFVGLVGMLFTSASLRWKSISIQSFSLGFSRSLGP